ncbi:hypothetical protein [Glycomyces sp. NPDC048151]|uniref:hypothetical protein n=1 Tax=Glycomyces sp. NPDC048151 TaxID=3364002 RepID=UPI00371EBE2F
MSGSDFTPAVTPVELLGGVWVKREDAWSRGGASGAKSRAMFTAAEGAPGLMSAGARISPQLERAALVAAALGIPARLHTGWGNDTDETRTALAAGATLLRHRPGRLSVIRARYRTDAAAHPDWAHVPFGMDLPVYRDQVAAQAHALEHREFRRIIVPVGSGSTLAAICCGLDDADNPIPVVGVVVGAEPTGLLNTRYPKWRNRTALVRAAVAYEKPVRADLGGLVLDPHYEAKCLPHLAEGDLLWAVGRRASADPCPYCARPPGWDACPVHAAPR